MSKQTKLAGTPSAGIEGFIDVTVVNKKKHYSRSFHNKITPAGLMAVQSSALKNMLGVTQRFFGMPIAYRRNWSECGLTQNSMPKLVMRNDYAYNSGLALFNMGDKKSNIPDSSCGLYIDSEQCIAIASNNTTTSGREGREVLPSPSNNLQDTVYSRKWLWDAGQLDCTFDAMQIGSLSSKFHSTDKSQFGVTTMKCLETRIGNTGRSATDYMLPMLGAEQSNRDTRIAYNSSDGTVSNWQYDIATGELQDSQFTGQYIGEALSLYGSNKPIDVYIADDDNVYVLVTGGTDFTVYKTNRGLTSKQSLSIRASETIRNRPIGGFVRIGNTLMVGVLCNTGTSSSNTPTLTTAKLGSWSGTVYTHNIDTSYTYATAGATVGTTALETSPIVDMGDGKYGLLIRGVFDHSIAVSCALTDMVNNIIDVKASMPDTRCRFRYGDGSIGFICSVARPSYSSYGATDTALSERSALSDTNVDVGLCFFKQEWSGTAMSMVVLQSPITVGPDESLSISYGYKVTNAQ